MSVHRTASNTKPWVVRWRDADGRHRSRSFATQADAKDFDKDRRDDARATEEIAFIANAVERVVTETSDPAALREIVRGTRALVNSPWQTTDKENLRFIRTANQLADALEQRINELEQS